MSKPVRENKSEQDFRSPQRSGTGGFARRARERLAIDQRNKAETCFFPCSFSWHVAHFMYARLAAARRGARYLGSQSARTRGLATRRGNRRAYATLGGRVIRNGGCGRPSGSNPSGAAECRSMARGTRNIRFRNELTLRPSNDPPSCGIPPRDGDR